MSDYEATAKEIWKSWYSQDYKEFTDALKVSIVNHINLFREKNPDVDVYGYSIYTCNGLPHFGPVLNTTKKLEENDSDPYYEYCPDEWSDWDDFHCLDKPKAILESLHCNFDESMERFEDIYEDGGFPINVEVEDYWKMNVERIFHAVLRTLLDLKEEGVFDWLSNSHRLILIWFSDSSEWEFSMSKKSIETLNSSEKASKFSAILR
jgi:hypothetical protein